MLQFIKDPLIYAIFSLSVTDVKELKDYVFYGFKDLKTVTMTDSITSIGKSAFASCYNLISINLSNRIQTIEYRCFIDCRNLVKIEIPNSVHTIRESAFAYCDDLQEVVIGNGLVSIEDEAFLECSNLNSIYSFSKNCPSLPSGYHRVFHGICASGILNIPTNSNYNNWLRYLPSGWLVRYIDYYVTECVEIVSYETTTVNWDERVGEVSIVAIVNGYDFTTDSNFKNKEISVNVLTSDIGINDDLENDVIKTAFVEYYGAKKEVQITQAKCEGIIFEGIYGKNGEIYGYHTVVNYVDEHLKYMSVDGIEVKPSTYIVFEGIENEYHEVKLIFDEHLTYSTSNPNFRTSPTSNLSILTKAKVTSNKTVYNMCDFCENLESVELNGNVLLESKDEYNEYCGLFKRCYNLKEIIINENHTYYDGINNCNAIIETESNTLLKGCQTTIIPNTITNIGLNAFNACINLTSITIPDSVTSINDLAFYSCKGLTEIVIPDSVTSISERAFMGCVSLESITIGSGLTNVNWVTQIRSAMFSDNGDNLQKIQVSNGNQYYDSRDNCNAIIKTSTNQLVYGCANTIIPYSVTSIGNDAFSACYGLEEIIIPDSVTSIGKNAFSQCRDLTKIDIPDSVKKVGVCAFEFCDSLTSVTIGSGVTSISQSAFQYCGGLTSVTIGSGVTNIGSSAFTYCDNLTEIVIPDSVTYISDNAFQYCSGLTSVTIGSGVTSISQSAFQYCNGLTCVNITSLESWCNINFTSYNNNPLYYAKNLYLNGELITDLVIPNSITSIGDYTFCCCHSLTSVTIGNSITSIGEYAFEDCSGLTSVTIGNSVTIIGSRAFMNCSGLTEIVIPNSVTSIGYYVFHACKSLTSITSYAKIAPTVNNVSFCGVPQNGTLYHQKGSDYSIWMKTNSYYLGYYNWTSQEIEVPTEETTE